MTPRRPRRPLDPARPRAGRFSLGYARLVVRLRYVIVAGWLALAAVLTFALPGIAGHGEGIDGFVPADSPAIATEIRSFEAFQFPLLSRTVLVQRDPDGLPPEIQADAALRAAAIARGEYQGIGSIVGVLPVTNTLGLFPSSSESGTTILNYFFMPPWVGFADQQRSAQAFADRFLDPEADAVVGVTGSIPARVEQARLVEESLPLVELATLSAIVLIVGLNFRSVVAPIVTLFTAGIAFVITVRFSAIVASAFGLAVPSELEPLIVALLLGIVTDYVIFFLSGFKHRLRLGDSQADAVRRATAEYAHIVAAAGITVAAGTAALLAARSPFFRTFGPGMALSVLVGLVVAVTFFPALMAILGARLFWPSDPGKQLGEEMPGPGPSRFVNRVFRGHGIDVMTRRRPAAWICLTCTVLLAVAALPIRHLDLGLSFVPSLPAENEVVAAADAAKAGFAEGILSPTVLLLEGDNVTWRRAQLTRLGDLIEQHPGVAGVLGPGDQVFPRELGVVLSRDRSAARYLIVLEDAPLGARGINTLSALRERLPDLLAETGLDRMRVGFAGDTALAEGIVDRTTADLKRIATAAILVNLLLLVLFLRALVAPLYLLGCSLLALFATLGLTVFVFQDLLGGDGLTFYVPFAAAVLLVALGSDYNIFGVGHVWEEARRRPLREAIMVAVPESTRAITAAGITLAVSFGLLALVPLRPFRELAFAMFVGILIDSIVVRSLLVPTLLTLFGRTSEWPNRRLLAPEPPLPEPAPAASG